MGIYDDSSEEIEAKQEVVKKKAKPRKRKTVSKKKTVKKKIPAAKAKKETKVVVNKKPEPSKRTKEILERATVAAKNEVKKHLDAGRSVSGRKNGEKVIIHPKPDSTNTELEHVDQPKITPEEFFASQIPKPEYIKHLIKCICILPQFLKMENPPDHHFVVFSVLDDQGEVKPHYAQCNNCGLIHKVLEVGISRKIKKETLLSLPTTKDLKPKLPIWLVEILEENNCELHVWQEAEFILKHELWGRFIVLVKERDENFVLGKVLQILGKDLYNIETFERDENYVEP